MVSSHLLVPGGIGQVKACHLESCEAKQMCMCRDLLTGVPRSVASLCLALSMAATRHFVSTRGAAQARGFGELC